LLVVVHPLTIIRLVKPALTTIRERFARADAAVRILTAAARENV
jgi:hypothetical protein